MSPRMPLALLFTITCCGGGSSESPEDASPVDTGCSILAETGGPAIQSVLSPEPHRVYQRTNGQADLPIGITLISKADCLEARTWNSDGTMKTGWTVLEDLQLDDLSGALGILRSITSGTFRVELRASLDKIAGPPIEVDPVSVGDVFLVAGQSNASFSGETPQHSSTMHVSYFDTERWFPCQDPVLLADPQGEGGAAWCLLGDLLFQSNSVPVAFVPMAWGGSSLHQWQQDSVTSPVAPGALFGRLMDVAEYLGPNGAKALLWHQGESELTEGTSIEDHAIMLNALIDGTRAAGGYKLPWLVSEASYLIDAKTLAPFLCEGLEMPACEQKIAEEQARVIAGQRAVMNDENCVFLGVSTDSLGPDQRHDGSHFTTEALHAVAGMWHERLRLVFSDIP